MSRKRSIALALSAAIGIASVAMGSGESFAFRRAGGVGHVGVGHARVGHVGVGHVGVGHVGVGYRAHPGVALGVGAAAAAAGAYRCGYYPYPACY